MEENSSLIYSLRFNFLYVDIYAFTRMWVYPTTELPYALLRFIMSGEAEFSIDGKLMHVKPNQVVYIPEGSILDCKALTDDFKFMSIRFVSTAQLKDGDLLSEHFRIPDVTDSDGAVFEHFDAIYKAATAESPGKVFTIRGHLELIIAWLTERGSIQKPYARPPDQDPYSIRQVRRRARRTNSRDPRIQAAEDYIAGHPKEPLDLKLLCEIAQLSEPSLRRLFKQQTGKSPGNYIKELHMLTAARELLVSEKRVSEIAYDLGYNDPNYFSRLFRAVHGLSPLEYRRVSREGTPPANG